MRAYVRARLDVCASGLVCLSVCLSVRYVRVYVYPFLSVCASVRACLPSVCLSVCHLSA